MAEAQAKHAGGRPTKFEPWMVRVGKSLFRLGATNDQVAEAFDVAPSTIDNWLAQNEEFLGASKFRELPDSEIERSLFERAKGYTTPDGQHIPAHPTSQIFWLKNRKPDKWRDQVETKHSGSVDVNHKADPASIANQLVTLGTQFPTLNPVIRNLAQSILDRLPELPGA